MSNKSERLMFMIEPELKAVLHEFAEKEGVSLGHLVRKAIRNTYINGSSN